GSQGRVAAFAGVLAARVPANAPPPWAVGRAMTSNGSSGKKVSCGRPSGATSEASLKDPRAPRVFRKEPGTTWPERRVRAEPRYGGGKGRPGVPGDRRPFRRKAISPDRPG